MRKEPPSTVGLLVCSMSGISKIIRLVEYNNSGGRVQAAFEKRLAPRSTGVLLWNFAERWDESGSYPVAWADGWIGFNQRSDLMFFSDEKWYLLDPHLKNGLSEVLCQAIR